ncbi:MAG: hypothetical protein JXA91_05595 [Candidatus Thermoplasmatota archaeon]|nr:hypothetical protein [Candidatus Thermoplasmatota archaeon]
MANKIKKNPLRKKGSGTKAMLTKWICGPDRIRTYDQAVLAAFQTGYNFTFIRL